MGINGSNRLSTVVTGQTSASTTPIRCPAEITAAKGGMTTGASGGTHADDGRLPKVLIMIDGPGGVGKSTVAGLVAQALGDRAVPVLSIVEPPCTPLGEHIRSSTETYRAHGLGLPPRQQHLQFLGVSTMGAAWPRRLVRAVK